MVNTRLRWTPAFGVVGFLGLCLAPAPRALVAQQPSDPVRSSVDSLLTAVRVEALIQDLGARFLDEVSLLVPQLTAEQHRALAEAVAEGFALAPVREDLLSTLAADASPGLVRDLLARHQEGAVGEMTRVAEAFQPQGTASEFLAGLGTPPRERLQRMVQLAELEGRGTLDLLLGESLREVAHRLVILFGADLPAFEPMSDEDFELAYRDRVLQLGFTNLHRLQPVSDDLLDRVLADLGSEAGLWYADAFSAAMIGAAGAAATRVAVLTVAVQEDVATPDTGLLCQGEPCLLWVDWEGPEPEEHNLRFGAPGALASRMLDNLGAARFELAGGPREERLLIRVVPTLMSTLCDYMAGTDSPQCQAIRDVRIEFRGGGGDPPNPPGFTVLNRCGSDGVLDVDGFGAFVAARLLHALHRPSEPAPTTPRC